MQPNSAVYQVRRNAGLRGEDIFGTRTLDDGSKLSFMEEVAQYAKLLPSKTKLGPQAYDQERFIQDLKRTIMGNQDSVEDIIAVARKNNPGKEITRASPEFATALNQVISNLTSDGGQTTATETDEIVDLSNNKMSENYTYEGTTYTFEDGVSEADKIARIQSYLKKNQEEPKPEEPKPEESEGVFKEIGEGIISGGIGIGQGIGETVASFYDLYKILIMRQMLLNLEMI